MPDAAIVYVMKVRLHTRLPSLPRFAALFQSRVKPVLAVDVKFGSRVEGSKRAESVGLEPDLADRLLRT